MSSHHKAMVEELVPSVSHRTYTLRELAHALEGIARRADWQDLMSGASAVQVADRWRVLPNLIAAHRRRLRRRPKEVADRYGAGEGAFIRMAEEIDPAVETLVRWESQFSR